VLTTPSLATAVGGVCLRTHAHDQQDDNGLADRVRDQDPRLVNFS